MQRHYTMSMAQQHGTASLDDIAQHSMAMAQLKGISFLMAGRCHHPSTPCTPVREAPNAETPPPIKTRIFYVNKNFLTEQAKFKLKSKLMSYG